MSEPWWQRVRFGPMRRLCGVPAAGWAAAGAMLVMASAAFQPGWTRTAGQRVLALLILKNNGTQWVATTPAPTGVAHKGTDPKWEPGLLRTEVMVRVTELLGNDTGDGPWRWLGFVDWCDESQIQIERDGIGSRFLDLTPMPSDDVPKFREGIVGALREAWPAEPWAQRIQTGELVRRTFNPVAVSYNAWHAARLLGIACIALGLARSLISRRDESRAERRRRGLCAQCGYAIGATPSDRCPECGAAVFGWR